jgi:hypothetical protein
MIMKWHGFFVDSGKAFFGDFGFFVGEPAHGSS